ncbi:MAG: HAMP domain-containing sensor histidine kinase [Candidatus Binatia bacterium]
MPRELAALLRHERATILERWQHRVAELVDTLHTSRIELLDHMPMFVDGLIAVLDGQTATAEEAEAPAQEAGAMHGAQRLSVGFDVDEVVREYGILADVFLEIVTTAGRTLATEDVRALFAAVNAGAAEAVREYIRRRDEELVREQARHRAFVAHELRTPLATALAASSLLTLTNPTLGEGRPMQLLGRSLQQVRELIDQVLIAGRLDAGIELDHAELDLVALVREIEDTLRPEAESRQVTIELVTPTTLVVQADRRLLHSAIANLLRNAVKYTRPASTVEITLHPDKDDAVLEVKDGCGGIVASNWATIFEPYARGDDAKSRQREGLGLGLAIAKQSAEAHGGTLSVRNLDGDGCVFELRLPLAAPVSA